MEHTDLKELCLLGEKIMKLTRENIYIDLRGKSKEELTDLWEFLNNAGEKQYDDKENFINDNYYNILSLDEDNEWSLCLETSIMIEDKKEVTIEQLKEILQPMDNKEQQLREEAKERGYTHDNFKCLNKSYNRTSIESLDRWYYNELEDTLFTNTRMNGGKAVYKNGIWADFIETLHQKEQRLLEELAEVRKEIEVNKIKVGDLVKCTNKESRAKCIVGIVEDLHAGFVGVGGHWYDKFEKITDSVLLESLNKLF